MKELKVSVIIPIRNEEKYIEKCIESILIQDFNKSEMEVIFIDGISEDNTVKIINHYINTYSHFKVLSNQNKTTPCALNIGICNAKGKYIIRMDAHSEYPSNYISKCIYYIEHKEADNVGCLVETVGEGKIGKSIAYVLSSKFGVGNSKFRTNAKSGYVDTVPFGTFRKELFNKIGLFDERLERNQDSEFNNRIIKNGGKIYLFNEIKIIYHPRNTIKGLIKMAILNGKWNVITNHYISGAMRLRHFIPLMFVLSLIIGCIISLFKIKYLMYLFIVELILYLFCDLVFSMKDWRQGIVQNLLSFIIFPVFHIAYGVGSLIGIFKVLKSKIILIKNNDNNN